ncbi:MAG: hypothetical protein IJT73_11840, partial [Selenomonadaceae bacterium]|nr:hypothetical protein [Selenomonadaceae bacterium]
MDNIQKLFSSGTKQINIFPGEYEGPFTIRHSCTIEGNGATIWAKSQVVLYIEADNVTIKNLRVERVNENTSDENFIAIKVNASGTQFENVEVYGGIGEPFNCLHPFPRMIDLGIFAANETHEFLFNFDKIEGEYKIINSMYGLKVETQNLSGEKKELRLTVEPQKDGAIIYGSLIFVMEKNFGKEHSVSKILRRVYISGRANIQQYRQDRQPDFSAAPQNISQYRQDRQ